MQPEYPHLAELFRDILRIREATSQMLLHELNITANDYRKKFSRGLVSKATSLVLEIGWRLPKENEGFRRHLKLSIQKSPCLPIRYPSVGVKLGIPMIVDFFLADRKYLYDEFKDYVPVLDFTLEELRSIDSMVMLFGFDKIKLSLVVKANTTVSGSQSVQKSRTDELRKKALAFYRYDRLARQSYAVITHFCIVSLIITRVNGLLHHRPRCLKCFKQ